MFIDNLSPWCFMVSVVAGTVCLRSPCCVFKWLPCRHSTTCVQLMETILNNSWTFPGRTKYTYIYIYIQRERYIYICGERERERYIYIYIIYTSQDTSTRSGTPTRRPGGPDGAQYNLSLQDIRTYYNVLLQCIGIY